MTRPKFRTYELQTRYSSLPPVFRILIPGFLILALIFTIRSARLENPAGDNRGTERISVAPPVDRMELGHERSFPLHDANGDNVSSIKYEVESAELRNELIVQGRKAGSVKGRTFLVLNVKLTNEFEQGIKVNSRDYVRLSVNGNADEWLAPDIHSDPVDVQAISTKRTKVAFPVNETDGSFKLRIGEINGEKEIVDLELTYGKLK